MRPFKRYLAAFEEQEISTPNTNFVRVKSSLYPIEIRTPDRELDVSLDQGDSSDSPTRFDSVYIKNGSQPQTITLQFGRGRIDSTRLAGDISTTVNSPSNASNPVDPSVPATSGAEIVAANPKRDHVVIVADGGNVADVRIGGPDVVDYTRGPKLAPGQSVSFYGSYAIHVYNPNASACTFQIHEAESA